MGLWKVCVQGPGVVWEKGYIYTLKYYYTYVLGSILGVEVYTPGYVYFFSYVLRTIHAVVH